MKATPKNVISPISRLIKLCNRQEFEKIIWSSNVFFPLPPSSLLSVEIAVNQSIFTTAPAILRWKQMFFYSRGRSLFCDFRLFWAMKALVLLGLVWTVLCEQSFTAAVQNCPQNTVRKERKKEAYGSMCVVWSELFRGWLLGCMTAGLLSAQA